MTSHSLLAFVPAPLLAAVLVLDLMRERHRDARFGEWVRPLVAVGLGAAVLTAFTGLGARRRIASALPGGGTPWDGHVIWAVVLLVVLLAVGIARLRTRWSGEGRRGWSVLLLDAVLLAVVLTITLTGVRTP